MNFKPKSEKELAEMNLLPIAEYDFQVIEAKDAISKGGNQMIALKHCVWAPDGSERHIYDYLLEAMAQKLNGFCKATGLTAHYEAGTLAAQDCLGKAGRLKIGIEKREGYPDKNTVKAYVIPKAGDAIAAKSEEVGDPETPF